MIDLYDAGSNRLLGSITEADLQVLIDTMEEESLGDRDYYINAATIDLIAAASGSAELVRTLREALGSSEDIDIRWVRPSDPLP